MAENMIKLGIKLDSNGAEKELQGTIKKLSNNNVKIKFDDKNINFSNINKQLSEIQNKLQQAFNFNTINKSAQESAKVFQGLADEIGKFHEKSDLKITTKEGLQEAKEVNQSLEQQYQAQLKINNLKNSLQTKLTTSKSNGFIDTSTIAELQNKLNSINTNTPEKEIKELESAIKNLASSDSNIVRVQNALSKFSTSYDNIKNKLKDGSLIADDQTEAKLKEYESELRKLKQLQNELQGGKAFSGSKITSELNGITNASRQLNNTLESNMHTSESFGTRIKDALGNMGVYFTAYQGVMLGVNALKDAVETVTSIDTKMRDLRRVTDDATSETLNNFPKQANEMAISLGQTTENAIQATTVWKQLGYTWEEATQYLSKESMILSNVGDMSAEDSTNALVSTLKAFKLEAKDTTSVVDSLNEAGNRFAIKTGELAEGLRVGGASLAIANNSLEQSEALIITGTEVLRDSNEVANGLKTIAMRLDQVKTAKGDTFYKLQSDLKNLAGTELTDANGNLRSTYDIILDLSKVWDSLSDMNQAKLLDEIAGKNQSKVLSAILQNAQQLPKAYDSMKNSAGSASKEQERYMDSIEAKTNALKESVKKLWIEMISSDTIKQFVDFLTSIVTALSNVDSGTVKLIATFTVLGLALKSIGTFTTALQTVGTVANLGKDAGAIGTLVKGFSGIGTSISGMTSSALAFISTPLGATLTGLAVATGVAVAGYEEYQDIMSKPTLSTTTDDLSTFGKVVNSVTGNVVKSKQELILAGSAYEDFSDDLSDKFKNSVEDASKSFNKLRMSLQFDGEQEIFSDKMSQGIKEQVDQIVKTAKQSVMDKRSEVQDTFTTLFSGDGLLDDNESGVLDSINEYEGSKFETIQTLNQNIYETLNNAVEQHGQLMQDDIEKIKNWTREIQALQIQANSQNEADEKYSSNESKFEKRLSSMTPKEALDEAKNTYNNIIDINQETEDKEKKTISDANAFISQLQDEYSKMSDSDKAGESGQKLANMIKTTQDSVTKAQDNLNNQVKTRQEETQKLWDAFYKENPDKKGKINEINFTEFSYGDTKSNEEFNEVMQWYPQVADVTETSMKRIQNANGKWSDVAVTVDKNTGKIVSIYDTTTGTVAGYSKQFEDDAEKTYSNLYNAQSKIVSLMNDTYSKTNNGSNFKLNGDDNFSIVDDKGVETTIEKMQQVINLSNGYKVAVANINGQQIKMEFDKDGTLQNYEDVLSAINGDKNSKAKIDFDVNTDEGKKKLTEIEEKLLGVENKKIKIKLDGSELSTVDDATKKLEELPQDKKVKINVNGEEAIMTAEQAEKKINDLPKDKDVDINIETDETKIHEVKGQIDNLPDKKECKITIDGTEETNIDTVYQKLSELPPDTKTDIIINGEQISTAGEAKAKLEEIPPETNTDINVDSAEADSNLETTQNKVDTLDNSDANLTVTADTSQAQNALDNLLSKMGQVSGSSITVGGNISTANLTVDGSGEDNIQQNANGTDNAKAGWSSVAEDGFEIVIGKQYKKLQGGETILNNSTSKEFLNAMGSSETEAQESVEVNLGNVYNAKKSGVQVPADNDGGYFPTQNVSDSSPSSSASSSSTGQSKAEKKAESEAKKSAKLESQIDDLNANIDIDELREYKNAISDIDNELTLNKTIIDGLKEDTIEYQMAQLKDIDLYEKKQQSVVALSMAQQDQSKTMQDDLSKYSFQFDAQGKLINGNQRLLELQNSINEMGGDTEEAKKSKQDAIKWLEDLSKKVKEYDTLTEDTIPKTINDYYELANSIKKVRDEMQKANEEKLGNLRDELAEDYLKDQQDKVDDLKKKAEEAKEDAKQALEDEKQSKLDEWDEKIKEKQAELDALNDDSADNETKLKKLQAELALWKKDNSTEAQKKV